VPAGVITITTTTITTITALEGVLFVEKSDYDTKLLPRSDRFYLLPGGLGGVNLLLYGRYWGWLAPALFNHRLDLFLALF
jgi:hypothetical protein